MMADKGIMIRNAIRVLWPRHKHTLWVVYNEQKLNVDAAKQIIFPLKLCKTTEWSMDNSNWFHKNKDLAAEWLQDAPVRKMTTRYLYYQKMLHTMKKKYMPVSWGTLHFSTHKTEYSHINLVLCLNWKW